MNQYLWLVRFTVHTVTPEGEGSFTRQRNYVHNYDIVTLLDRILFEARSDTGSQETTIRILSITRGVEVQA